MNSVPTVNYGKSKKVTAIVDKSNTNKKKVVYNFTASLLFTVAASESADINRNKHASTVGLFPL